MHTLMCDTGVRSGSEAGTTASETSQLRALLYIETSKCYEFFFFNFFVFIFYTDYKNIRNFVVSRIQIFHLMTKYVYSFFHVPIIFFFHDIVPIYHFDLGMFDSTLNKSYALLCHIEHWQIRISSVLNSYTIYEIMEKGIH